MKNRAIISIASAGLMICTLGIKDAYADTNEGTINASTLNIRSGPSTNHGVVTKAKRGSKVTILNSSDGWHQVRLSNNKEGWASGQYVSIGSSEGSVTQPQPESPSNPSDTSNSGKVGTVNTSSLNVRSGPSTSYGVVSKVKRGNNVTIIGSQDGWHKVKLSNGAEGWVSGKYINLGGGNVESSNPAPSPEPSPAPNPSDTSNSGKVGTVNTSSLNVRSGPSTSYGVVSKTKRGNTVTIIGSQNGWHKVKLSNGVEGWASGQYIKIGGGSTESSNSSNNSKNINVVATAYTGYSTTSTGQKPVWGTIAVDPKVIPYGTRVYIPHFDQVFVANNTGGAIKGNKIDIFMNSKQECYNWGRRTIEIQILD